MSCREPARAMKAARRSGADDEVICTDDWGPGLHYGHKALSAWSVKRAKDFYEVIEVALQHNLRIGNEKHRHRSPPDPARKHLNSVLVGPGTPEEGSRQAQQEFDALGIAPLRWDNIPAVESVYQSPAGWDCDEFWRVALNFAQSAFGPVLSAVVHRDQAVAHMHVITLAIADGKLAGAVLTSGGNSLSARRCRFMAHMRAELGLRPDRSPTKPKKSMTAIFTSPGNGPRRHDEAERLDAEFVRLAPKKWAKRLEGQEVAPTSCARPLIAHRLEALSDLFARGIESGAFTGVPGRPLEPAPRPEPTQHGTAVSAASAAPPVQAMPGLLGPAPPRALVPTLVRAFKAPAGLLATPAELEPA